MGPSADERLRLVERYAAGDDDVMAALGGLTAAELGARGGPGAWSPRGIVRHPGGGELGGAGRIRMLVAARRPRLVGWDQDRWVELLSSDERPLEASPAALTAAREATLPLLRLPTEGQWRAAGTHSEFGPMTGDDWPAFYGTHARAHADQIRRARAAARAPDGPGGDGRPRSGPAGDR